jgi:hypothetical protein
VGRTHQRDTVARAGTRATGAPGRGRAGLPSPAGGVPARRTRSYW